MSSLCAFFWRLVTGYIQEPLAQCESAGHSCTWRLSRFFHRPGFILERKLRFVYVHIGSIRCGKKKNNIIISIKKSKINLNVVKM